MSRPEQERNQAVPTIADEPPPILGRWPRVYTVVLVYLAAVIAAFYFLTRYFSR